MEVKKHLARFSMPFIIVNTILAAVCCLFSITLAMAVCRITKRWINWCFAALGKPPTE